MEEAYCPLMFRVEQEKHYILSYYWLKYLKKIMFVSLLCIAVAVLEGGRTAHSAFI
jgi:hypothetical protein